MEFLGFIGGFLRYRGSRRDGRWWGSFDGRGRSRRRGRRFGCRRRFGRLLFDCRHTRRQVFQSIVNHLRIPIGRLCADRAEGVEGDAVFLIRGCEIRFLFGRLALLDQDEGVSVTSAQIGGHYRMVDQHGEHGRKQQYGQHQVSSHR